MKDGRREGRAQGSLDLTLSCDGEALECSVPELTEEELRTRIWRFEQLLSHGYSPKDACLIAGDKTIDLEFARRLVSKLGCPPQLAARVVL